MFSKLQAVPLAFLLLFQVKTFRFFLRSILQWPNFYNSRYCTKEKETKPPILHSFCFFYKKNEKEKVVPINIKGMIQKLRMQTIHMVVKNIQIFPLGNYLLGEEKNPPFESIFFTGNITVS